MTFGVLLPQRLSPPRAAHFGLVVIPPATLATNAPDPESVSVRMVISGRPGLCGEHGSTHAAKAITVQVRTTPGTSTIGSITRCQAGVVAGNDAHADRTDVERLWQQGHARCLIYHAYVSI